ncbi:MAG: hypothetical protein PQJ60_04880 [Spirochaetales bacterium]|nr:hypothetical protein [Spirochaetales bacterium]
MAGTKVFALVGKSGTGKSFRARLVAEHYNISLMVDDGLLIRDTMIIAGRSAKKESNYVGAIKTALFDDISHRQEVLEAVKREKAPRILLIGTSEKMVQKVAVRLELPPITKFINIEEISSQEEIERAIKSRKEGKHVIPVPSIEIEKDYSRIFLDSIKVLFKRNFGKKDKSTIYEKSVVQPDFDSNGKRGSVTISEAALSQMILHCIDEFNCEIKVRKIKVRSHSGAYNIKVYIETFYGDNITEELFKLRKYIAEKIERFSGIILNEVTLSIDSVSQRKKEK